ncbi:hypothetical protein [Natronobacterium texcoconense]|uniref:Uncharacterized protein n=1 Tax=Natronobacterium texcoconense TaxID=1095778 RepID=A0A1H1BK36_NATTX|nr:hypothetical protein [Natronobacterium texcoconense]SDQ52318.1 hypothetical protein SAMN04489842_1069 [Natronobacterium texcoconense]
MTLHLLEWFRDEDGDWTVPDGREGELLVLLVFLPVVGAYAHLRFDFGWPQGTAQWIVATLGLFGGYLYAIHVREYVLRYVSTDYSWLTPFLLFGSGIAGLGEYVLRRPSILLPCLVAGGTVLVVYSLWLLSPFQDGLEPARRGVEPPSAVELD